MTDISRLPKWVQQHIAELQRQRDSAVAALNAQCDAQTPSAIWIDRHECTGEEAGPTVKRQYVQARRIEMEWYGVHLEIMLRDPHGDNAGIFLSWYAVPHRGDVAFIPNTYQQARLVSRENMYPPITQEARCSER